MYTSDIFSNHHFQYTNTNVIICYQDLSKDLGIVTQIANKIGIAHKLYCWQLNSCH